MRATIFLFVFCLFLGAILWLTLSGALFAFGFLLWLIFVIITVGYQDTMLLFLLGAREVRSSDEKSFFEAASQEAYKLSVPMPRLYFYNGSLSRAFIFQKRSHLSLVLSKSVLEKTTSEEQHAICFELLLQVKKRMASKRTKAMFLLTFPAWLIHSLCILLVNVVPFKDLRKVINWLASYLLRPTMESLFKLVLGESYFKKLSEHINEYPVEKEMLERVGLKLRKPFSYYSLPSRKLLELTSVNRSHQYQSIMSIEFLPHEWDYLFNNGELKRAE